jgi:hypothetical protein
MTIRAEQVAHSDLVNGSGTTLHSHAGGGSVAYKSGTVTTDGGGVATITFNTPFADTNYAIALGAMDSGDTETVMWDNKAVDGFTVKSENDRGQDSTSVTFNWIAIGYSNP